MLDAEISLPAADPLQAPQQALFRSPGASLRRTGRAWLNEQASQGWSRVSLPASRSTTALTGPSGNAAAARTRRPRPHHRDGMRYRVRRVPQTAPVSSKGFAWRWDVPDVVKQLRGVLPRQQSPGKGLTRVSWQPAQPRTGKASRPLPVRRHSSSSAPASLSRCCTHPRCCSCRRRPGRSAASISSASEMIRARSMVACAIQPMGYPFGSGERVFAGVCRHGRWTAGTEATRPGRDGGVACRPVAFGLAIRLL